MLKFHKNPYDTFTELKSAMGLDPHPLWMLIFDKVDCTYSAVNYKDNQDICDYSLKNNIFGVCLVDPSSLINILEFKDPHLICEALFEWCTMKRPDPEYILLTDFMPPKGYLFNSAAVSHLRQFASKDVAPSVNYDPVTPLTESTSLLPVDIDCSSVPFIGSSRRNGTDPVDENKD